MDEIDERRAAELEFVSAAYTSNEAWFDETLGSLPRIHRRLSLKSANETAQSTVQLILTMSMTPGYPGEGLLEVTATIDQQLTSSDTSLRKLAMDATPKLVEACRCIASESIGNEAVFAVLSRADEWVANEWSKLVFEAPKKGEEKDTAAGMTVPKKIILGRRLIYSHHIISKIKRGDMKNLASHYNLTGRMKIGWPGIILIEGEEADVIDFVDEINKWQWKHLVVRGEQQEPVPSSLELDTKRKFGSFYELDDMSVLAKECREVGLESLFRTSMKIYTKEEGDNNEDNTDNCLEDTQYGALVHVDHMNDGKNYRKWLRKTSKEVQCSELVKQIYPADDFTKRPIIIVAVVGSKENVQQFMKRWRTSRVDVDSKGRACLERQMKVIIEDYVNEADISEKHRKEDSVFHAKEQTINVSCDELIELISKIGGKEWIESLNNEIMQLRS